MLRNEEEMERISLNDSDGIKRIASVIDSMSRVREEKETSRVVYLLAVKGRCLRERNECFWTIVMGLSKYNLMNRIALLSNFALKCLINNNLKLDAYLLISFLFIEIYCIILNNCSSYDILKINITKFPFRLLSSFSFHDSEKQTYIHL